MTGRTILPRNSIYVDRTDLARLAKPAVLHRLPIHRWFVFPHSYSHTLVEQIIESWKLKSSDRILDPFVGAGTTLLAAKQFGIPAVGLDILPLSVLASNVKSHSYHAPDLEKQCDRFFRRLPIVPPSVKDPAVPLLRRAFSKTAWQWLMFLRRRINKMHDKWNRQFFLLASLRTARVVCGATSDGGWLRWMKRKPIGNNVPDRMKRILLEMIQDVHSKDFSKTHSNEWKAVFCDARFLKSDLGKFSAVICSPPYPNRHDYSRVFAPELLIGFVDNEELKELRYSSFRSHVEAKDPGYQRNGYLPPRALRQTLNKLQQAPLTNRLVMPMVEGYFRDTFEVLRVLRPHLRKNARLAFVVGNVRHAGVMVEVDKYLARIAEDLGYQCEKIWVIRLRGNSAQQMGTFGRIPARESIVFLRKQ